MSKKAPPETIEEKLDVVIHHLRKLDKRDRLRTLGGFLKSTLHLAYLGVILYGFWYMYQNWDAILLDISKAAAEQAAAVTAGGIEALDINALLNQLK